MAEKPQTNYLVDAWLILALALVFGGALAGVHIKLNPRIEENKLNESLNQIPALVPGADKALTEQIQVGDTTVFKAMSSQTQQAGWVISASGQGFADIIELLIGVDPDVQRVTGMFVLKNNETPGLGNRIVEEKWRLQFKDKPADRPITVVKREPTGGDQIQAVTGATISSDSVVTIVNRALADIGPQLRARAGEGE